MPSFVITEKCDGCKAQDKRLHVSISVPHDLMALDREKMKAYIRTGAIAGSALNCVKICLSSNRVRVIPTSVPSRPAPFL